MQAGEGLGAARIGTRRSFFEQRARNSPAAAAAAAEPIPSPMLTRCPFPSALASRGRQGERKRQRQGAQAAAAAQGQAPEGVEHLDALGEVAGRPRGGHRWVRVAVVVPPAGRVVGTGGCVKLIGSRIILCCPFLFPPGQTPAGPWWWETLRSCCWPCLRPKTRTICEAARLAGCYGHCWVRG